MRPARKSTGVVSASSPCATAKAVDTECLFWKVNTKPGFERERQYGETTIINAYGRYIFDTETKQE